MDDTELLNLIKSIDDITKCPICLVRAQPPMTACVNGHAICTKCRNVQVTECPLCMQEFLTTRPHVLEQLLEVLPGLCKYAIKGCTAISRFNRHERFCKYREMRCMLGQNNLCDWRGTVKDWLAHGEDKHFFLTNQMTDKFLEISHSISDLSWTSKNFRLTVESNVFVLHTKRLEGELIQYIKHIPFHAPTHLHHFTLIFKKNQEVVYKFPIKAANQNEKEIQDNSLYSLWVPIANLQLLANEYGTVTMFIEYTKTSIPTTK
uniref:E3 ubiquitin-protein ligase Sina-like RING finger domain-containing protein n=1 Tax=Graphocephala atropunctata TaxID=36148 RepID=A0A1B6KP41_9HEMI